MAPSISSNNLSAIVEDLTNNGSNDFAPESEVTSIEQALAENLKYEKRQTNTTEKIIQAVVKSGNHHIKSFNSNIYGYMVVNFLTDGLLWEVYV